MSQDNPQLPRGIFDADRIPFVRVGFVFLIQSAAKRIVRSVINGGFCRFKHRGDICQLAIGKAFQQGKAFFFIAPGSVILSDLFYIGKIHFIEL